jgi:hypothetical protein
MSKRAPRPGEGRPTKFKPEFCEQLIAHMSEGYGPNTFGAKVGVARETIYVWIKEIPEFGEAHKLGLAHYEKVWEQMGMQGVMGSVQGFNASAWIFNMKNRFKWTDRQETTHEAGESIKVILEDYLK